MMRGAAFAGLSATGAVLLPGGTGDGETGDGGTGEGAAAVRASGWTGLAGSPARDDTDAATSAGPVRGATRPRSVASLSPIATLATAARARCAVTDDRGRGVAGGGRRSTGGRTGTAAGGPGFGADGAGD